MSPGDLIHADKHGFMVITPEEQPHLLDAAKFMDTNECETVIAAARSSAGLTTEEVLEICAKRLSNSATMSSRSLQKAENGSAIPTRGHVELSGKAS